MVFSKSRQFQMTVPFLLSKFILEMETIKTDPKEEWIRQLMILRNQYVIKCPDEYRHDFEIAINGLILGKINRDRGNITDEVCLSIRKLQNEEACRVRYYVNQFRKRDFMS